jgi:hypothetical protein
MRKRGLKRQRLIANKTLYQLSYTPERRATIIMAKRFFGKRFSKRLLQTEIFALSRRSHLLLNDPIRHPN